MAETLARTLLGEIAECLLVLWDDVGSALYAMTHASDKIFLVETSNSLLARLPYTYNHRQAVQVSLDGCRLKRRPQVVQL